VQSGFAALAAGEYDAAVRCCREALAVAPRFARAHFLAGQIALQGDARGEARRAFEQVVNLNSSYAPAWAELARIYVGDGEFVKAEGCLANALKTERGSAELADLIGTVYRMAGNLDASREWYRRAVEQGSRVPFLINLANAELYHGNLDLARQLMHDALAQQPDNPQLHWMLASTRAAVDDGHIRQMLELAGQSTHARATAYLQYAIGKECEDLQQWDAAFEAFSIGAAARRQTVQYDETAEQRLFDAARRRFTRDWLARQRSKLEVEGPVFIVGEPRTGTTLLDRMLCAHSEVSSAGELRHFGLAARRATGVDEPRQFSAGLLEAVADGDAQGVGNAYLRSIRPLRSGRYLIDKLPMNYLYLPAILAALPRARIIHVTREPMDACFAVFKQLFADAYLYSYDLGETARHHRRYRDLMDTWRERFTGRFLDVAYEDLVSDSERSLKRVLAHLGLEWQDACLAGSQSQGPVGTASAVQVREAPHGRSVGRWQRYAERLEPARRILERGRGT